MEVARRAVVVEKQANPSTDYFILPALESLGCVVERRRLTDLPPPDALHGALVVLVRYLSPDWADLLARERHRLGRLVFFMDDDVLDTAASRGVRLVYRWRLWRQAARFADWLAAQQAELWVSTPYLQQKYATRQPRLVLPAALPRAETVRRIFYHGTASHMADIRWLKPVMEQVLDADPNLSFEIAGSRAVAALFGLRRRITVVHPMSWPAYESFATLDGRHVGLAPQLPSPFNAARSYTKFFDITRSGAVGVYAAGSACAAVVTHGHDGLVLPMEPRVWVEGILQLARDDLRRAAMLEAARETMARLHQTARQGYGRLDAGGE